MKWFSIIFTILAVLIMAYNAIKINLETPLKGESITAIITILAALCAVLIIWILKFSKQILKQLKNK